MQYSIVMSSGAEKDYAKLKKDPIIKKYYEVIDKIRENPYADGDNFKWMQGYKDDTFSRRLNKKHRVLYSVSNRTITILIISCWGHYGD